MRLDFIWAFSVGSLIGVAFCDDASCCRLCAIVKLNYYFVCFASVFKGGDKLHSYETNADNVIVYGSTGKHDHGSSKIKLKNIVDYKWEVKNYMGRLIAIHIGGKYVAYAIKGKAPFSI